MKELTIEETQEVSGGILPLIGLGFALIGKVTAGTGVLTWGLASSSLILATYEAAKWAGDN